MNHIIDKDVRLNDYADYYARIRELVSKPYNPPNFKIDKGIVYCAGGARYFKCAFASAYTLQQLGCKLPIQFWYIGDKEMNTNMKKLCDKYNIQHINAINVCKQKNLGINFISTERGKSRNFEIKPLSILCADIKEVLFLDADNIPAKDPTYLFEDMRFRNPGAMFWPDFDNRDWIPEKMWKLFSLTPRQELDFETGQILIDKARCYKELCLTLWMNIHSKFFYKHIHGDKSTFHLIWRKCNRNYHLNNKPPGWQWQCILQYDPDNNLVFQHAVHGKDQMSSGNVPAEIINHGLVNEAAIKRKEIWDGRL